MMSVLEKKGALINGNTWVVVTGTDGYANAQQQMINLGVNSKIVFNHDVTQSNKPGGADVSVGFNFSSFNINGNSVTFIKHPLLDDEQRFPARGADGKLISSGMMIFLTMNNGGKKNIEILAKGANGMNRAMVTKYINGLTGDNSVMTTSEEDAIKYAMLREDMIVVYNTTTCGIIHKQ
jgi:hypothetical protein